MTTAPKAAYPDWNDVVLVTSLFALDPAGLTWHVKSSAGPVRDALLAMLRNALPDSAPLRRCPLGIGDDRLLGGLDLASTLACGRRVAQRGMLAETDGGVLVLPMAERLTREAAARLCPVLDHGEVLVERDGVASRNAARLGLILLDEGVAEEQPPAALVERSAFQITLDGLSISDLPLQDLAPRVAAARRILSQVRANARIIEALCQTAQALGIVSLRAPMMALRIAQASAALDGRLEVTEQDATVAARLVLAWRATRLPVEATPSEQDEHDQTQEPREGQPETDNPDRERNSRDLAQDPAPDQMPDQMLEAVLASLPSDLLGRLQAQADTSAAAGGGRVAAGQAVASLHGRPLFTRAGRPERGKRLAVVDTLRTAAPWQALRRDARQRSGIDDARQHAGIAGKRVEVRASDFRVVQCEQRPRNIAIFVVDASGSAATGRLAEAKGAIERLLADCYVRRDRVALIAFRGTGAELLLPPTGALTRARRSLAGLPGGGGTPLATGLEAATSLALSLRARGETPLVVLLTDGRANITRAGAADRVRAGEEAGVCASQLRTARVSSLLVDISPRPEVKAEALALKMGALYLKLPDATGLSRAVREAAA